MKSLDIPLIVKEIPLHCATFKFFSQNGKIQVLQEKF